MTPFLPLQASESNTMEGTSLDFIQDLIRQIKQVVPQAFTEGKLDHEQLKTLLSGGNTTEESSTAN